MSAIKPKSYHYAKRVTGRQKQVLLALADGMTVKQIAATLAISPRTVQTHSRQGRQVLGLTNLRQVELWALLERARTEWETDDARTTS